MEVQYSNDYQKSYEISFEVRCLERYNINNNQIISTTNKISHDGYDEWGPESNLYDYYLLFVDNNKIYCAEFHREYWFHGKDDEEYYLVKNNIFNRCISDELIKKQYYIADESSLDDVDKVIYTADMLSFEGNQNSSKIMNIDEYSKVSLFITNN